MKKDNQTQIDIKNYLEFHQPPPAQGKHFAASLANAKAKASQCSPNRFWNITGHNVSGSIDDPLPETL